MSNAALNHVWKHSKMRGSALILMLALADMANDDGECWPGKANLSRKCRVSPRQVQRVIQDCERAGELQVIEVRDEKTGAYKSNRYIVCGVGVVKKQARKPKPAPQKRAFPTNDTSVTRDTDVSTLETRMSPPPRDTDVSESLSIESLNNHAPKNGAHVSTAALPETTFDDLPSYAESVANGAPPVKTKRRLLEEAIYEAFGWDEQRATPNEKGQINKAVAQLWKAKYRAEHIPTIYSYCARHFTGIPFTPLALASHAQAALNERVSANGSNIFANVDKAEAERDAGDSWLRQLEKERQG